MHLIYFISDPTGLLDCWHCGKHKVVFVWLKKLIRLQWAGSRVLRNFRAIFRVHDCNTNSRLKK